MEVTWRDSPIGRWVVALLCVAVVQALVACGGDAESEGPTVSQHITRDFGKTLLGSEEAAPLDRNRDAFRLLRNHESYKFESGPTARNWTVMRTIDGLTADNTLPDETTWVYMVNGVRAEEFPLDYRLRDGDVVQWDLRPWLAERDAPATVGAFPQTFTHGILGKRLPVTMECARPAVPACEDAKAAFADAGVDLDGSEPPGGAPAYPYPTHARVLVGPWSHWRGEPGPDQLGRRVSDSGVFARFAPDGGTLSLLDSDGHKVRGEGAGTGLVAATIYSDELIWMLTGVDDRGVERAVAALGRPDLRDAFAAAVTDDGIEKLPLKRAR